MSTTTLSGQAFSRAQFESLLKKRFFFTESFEIYRTAPNYKGDNRGLFDYGPPGCALLNNIVNEWRRHFVIEENMLELDSTSHYTRGCAEDEDPEKGEFLRADHLIETVLETRIVNSKLAAADSKSKTERLEEATIQQYGGILAKLDNYDGPELGKLIKDLDIRNPNVNGKVEEPTAFNLMFKSTIGRNYRQGSMPFASACIGKSYRNEILPRSGLLRVREFLVAEVEHFVDPESNKAHERFSEIEQIELPFRSKQTQLSRKPTIETRSVGSAVKNKLVDSGTLGYFLVHSKATGTPLTVKVILPETLEITEWKVLSLPILTAPTKVLLVPLSNNPSFKPIIKSLGSRLRSMGIANNVDASSVSIGRRYARNDELGSPLGITVDFDTVKDGSTTLRERDSTAQVRASEDQAVQAVRNLVSGFETRNFTAAASLYWTSSV